MVIFKTEVKHCRLEYAPSESILRAWFHQRHQANLNCVMGILIIGKYTPITASGDENLQTQIFESGDKRIRLVFNHNYCNDRAKNTKTDPYGNKWVDDEWIKTMDDVAEKILH